MVQCNLDKSIDYYIKAEKTEGIMYEIGDKVLYGGEGICEITGIEDRKIGDKLISYYILKHIDGANSVFLVPINSKVAETKLRKVIKGNEIKDIFKMAKKAPWKELDKERREMYRLALCNADREAIASLVKMVCEKKKELSELGKKLHKVDEYFLTEAEKLLYGEIETFFHVKKGEVVPFILGDICLKDK